MKNSFLSFLILLSFQMGFSQKNFVMKGSSPAFAGETIRVYINSDLITYRELRIAEAPIDASGQFKLSAPLNEITYCRIAIGYANGDMYIEPGKTYELAIDTAGGQVDERTNLSMNNLTLAMSFKNLAADDINQLIYNFDKLFDDFTYLHFNDIYKKKNKTLIDTLMHEISAMFSPIKNEFFRDYINYRVASLAQTVFGMNRYKLFKKYIANRPIAYNNPEYMSLFNSFYALCLYSGTQKESFYALADAINNNDGYFKITDMLGKDSLLRNEAIRDLVLIKGLGEIYNDVNIKQESVIRLLEQIGRDSKFERHRAVAASMITVLKRFEKGSAAPDFTLNDKTENPVSLSDFKGKYVMLVFWNSLCNKCILEMDVMKKLYDKFQDNFAFVNVGVDLNKTRYGHFIQSAAYPWPLLYFDGNYNLLDDYSLKSLPFFILIDRKGNFYKYPSILPSENLDGLFQAILKEEKK